MIKTVNRKGMRQAVWDYLLMPGHDRPMIVWCQWGTYAIDEVRDVVWTHGRFTDKFRVTNNDDESVDIRDFIRESVSRKKEDERLICVSVMPFDNPEDFMAEFTEEFECIRYQVDPQEWIERHPHEIHEPIVKFIRKHPEYLMMPYGVRPAGCTTGPCPTVWLDIAKMWAWSNMEFMAERYKRGPKKMVRRMMVDVASSMGVCEPLFTKLKWYLLLHRGYRNLLLPEREFRDNCHGVTDEPDEPEAKEGGAHFTNVFDDKGEPIWK